MKAVVRHVYGSPDVLRLADVDPPVLAADQVLVRVAAAGLDRGVWHLLTGLPYPVRLAGYGVRRPTSPLLGVDVAGQVEAVGAAVTRFRPGDEVMGFGAGSFAELVAAREDKLVLRPVAVDVEQAGAAAISGTTALQALRDHGRVRAGQRVLVLGASGGVGTFAVQLAKAYGAEVTGVCGPAKTDLVGSLGADRVLDHTRDDIGGPYELILDIGGCRPLPVLRRALTARGTAVIVGAENGGRWLGGADRQLRAIATAPVSRRKIKVFIAKENGRDVAALAGLMAAGTVRTAVDRTCSLGEVPEAIRRLHAGHARGKIVITV